MRYRALTVALLMVLLGLFASAKGALANSVVSVSGACTLTSGGDVKFNTLNVGQSETCTATLKIWVPSYATIYGMSVVSAVCPPVTSKPPFSITSDGCKGKRSPSYPSGGYVTCSVTYKFQPTSAGNFMGDVAVRFDGNSDGTCDSGAAWAWLWGQATGPTISVSPTSYNYGNVNVGSSSSKTFTVSNTGNATLTVSSVTLSDTTNYTVTSNNCSSVAAGGSCSITVRFNPTSVGTKSASLTIQSNASNSPTTNVSLTGVGVGATISVSPSSKNFGEVFHAGWCDGRRNGDHRSGAVRDIQA